MGLDLAACVNLVLNLGQCRGLQTLDERDLAVSSGWRLLEERCLFELRRVKMVGWMIEWVDGPPSQPPSQATARQSSLGRRLDGLDEWAVQGGSGIMSFLR